MQKEAVDRLDLGQAGSMPGTGFCPPLKWSWLKYLLYCAVWGFYERTLDRSSGCLVGKVIRYLGSASACWRNLWVFPLGLSLEPHLPALKSLTCFSLFFFFRVVNVSSLLLSPVWADRLSIMTFGSVLLPLSLPFLWFHVAVSRTHFSKDRWWQPCSL